jgi:DNA-binding transcriptional regulator GbsR (MarR family)
MKIMKASSDKLKESKEEFIAQWGALGTQWGINRTMAQIHALLMISPQSMCTDEVMEELEVSRGNAHTNLKELVAWGLIRMIVIKGDRRDFYEAEKDVWQIFRIIARERKRREIEPALALLSKCAEETKDLKGDDAKTFHKQVSELQEFVGLASHLSDRVAAMKHNIALQIATKLLG